MEVYSKVKMEQWQYLQQVSDLLDLWFKMITGTMWQMNCKQARREAFMSASSRNGEALTKARGEGDMYMRCYRDRDDWTS